MSDLLPASGWISVEERAVSLCDATIAAVRAVADAWDEEPPA